MEPFQAFCANVLGSDIKSGVDVPRCLRPKNLIEFFKIYFEQSPLLIILAGGLIPSLLDIESYLV